jgi:lipoprotein-anchoring transpeptidase ErfK/SrfK
VRRPLVTLVVLFSIAVTAIAVGRLVVRRSVAPAPVPTSPRPRTAAEDRPEIPPVPQTTDGHPLPEVLVDPTVVIDKTARRVTVFSEGTPVKGYRAALGRVPGGAKEREGDGKTPEGEFYVCSKNASSKYHRALGLSYPSEKDADRGLASGLISKREHRAIVTALHRMQQPPWKTALGGEIMIHGNGSGRGDWTLGCLALDDDDIEELFTALPLGTPVEIRP